MSVISVDWEYKSYRVNVTPNTLLRDVLIESCKYFKIDLSNDNYDYELVNLKGTSLDLSNSIRFSNLVQGSHVEIRKCNSNDNNILVNIRANVSIENGNNYVITRKISNNITINEYLQNIIIEEILKSDEKFEMSRVKFIVQIMMKVVSDEEMDKKLKDIGLIQGNYGIRIMIKDGVKKMDKMREEVNPKTEKEKEKEITNEDVVMKDDDISNDNTDINLKTENKSSVDVIDSLLLDEGEKGGEEKEDAKFIKTIIRSEKHFKINNESDDDGGISVEQLKGYQKILSKRAENEPLMTRSMREKKAKEKEELKNSFIEIKFRVKFPDNEIIQISIDKNRELRELRRILFEDVLNEEIVNKIKFDNGNKIKYSLSEIHPYKVIFNNESREDEMSIQLKDLKFINRVSLMFKIEIDGNKSSIEGIKFVKNSILPIDDINRSKMNGNNDNDDKKKIGSGVVVEEEGEQLKIDKNSNNKFEKSIGKKNNKIVPSWLKLNKK